LFSGVSGLLLIQFKIKSWKPMRRSGSSTWASEWTRTRKTKGRGSYYLFAHSFLAISWHKYNKKEIQRCYFQNKVRGKGRDCRNICNLFRTVDGIRRSRFHRSQSSCNVNVTWAWDTVPNTGIVMKVVIVMIDGMINDNGIEIWIELK
jgi:hypothetical protein